MLVDLLTSLQKNIEKLHKAEGRQQEAQHLSRKARGDGSETLCASPVTFPSFSSADGGDAVKNLQKKKKKGGGRKSRSLANVSV